MGSGYIQLLAVGSEVNIFNYNPNISFFKIYYRRHTNFYINNMEINGNNLKTNTENINNIITYVIPKNGDLLGKTYLDITIDKHHFELFKYNDELGSTLNINLLDVYNSFYIKVNNYSINDINNILIVKINFIVNSINNNKLSLVSNIFSQYELLNLIKSEKYYSLEKDIDNIFYNIDLNLLFYSFNVISNYSTIHNDLLFQYLIKNILYDKLTYVQINFYGIKLSIKITYMNQKYYKILLDLILSNIFINNVNQIKIDPTYVFIGLLYSKNLYDLLFDLLYVNSKIFYLEIINNKINSINNIYTEKIQDKLNFLILNKKSSTSVFLSIFNGDTNSHTILTSMLNITFFGNLTNEYFNDVLIKNSNEMLDIINLNNYKLSLNLLIKVFVSLFCYNRNSTIQNYLKYVNENTNKKSINDLNQYASNMPLLNEKLIEFIMNPNVLIVTNKTFYLILYSKNIYENFELIKYVKPFTYVHISYYSSIIENYYFNKNTINTFSNVFNNISDDNNYVNSLFLFFGSLTNSNNGQSVIQNDLTLNYIYNNNLFEVVSNNIANVFSQDSNRNLIFNYFLSLNDTNVFYSQAIINNVFLLLLIESLTFNSENFYFIQQNYNPMGKLSKLYINSNKSLTILPYSSFIYVFTNNINKNCENNKISNNTIYYNYELIDYLNNVEINIDKITYKLLNNIKTNIMLNFSNINVKKYIEDSQFLIITKNYYLQTTQIIQKINMKVIDSFLDEIKNLQYDVIYPIYSQKKFNFNSSLMYQQFTYVDKKLFNSSFSNFEYYKYSSCNEASYKTTLINENVYEKFIFITNSPIYRIYFFYTFISKFTIDLSILNVIINDDIVSLRDLTLSFLLYYFNIFNQYEFDNNIFGNYTETYNLNRIDNYNYFISSNFSCYDNINIFFNDYFLKNIINKNSNEYLFLYTNFYFNKLNLQNFKINDINFLNKIPNICSQHNYNYDDLIIILFLQILNDNSDKFINFISIFNLTFTFFDKNELKFNEIINLLKIYDSEFINNSFDTNYGYYENFYYNCYYTNFAIGTTFDNINRNNILTINNLFNITSLYDNQYLFAYDYSLKEYSSKQYNNFLNTTSNIIDVFKYFSSKLFGIFDNSTYIDENYYDDYLNLIISYTNVNKTYLLLYLISEFDFNNSVLIIKSTIDKFNLVNNTNISLSTVDFSSINNSNIFYAVNSSKFNFIIIIYLYIYFIYKCLSVDVNNYNSFLNNLNADFINGINVDLIVTFGEFIINKYTYNIYNSCIESLIKQFTESSDNISIDFSTKYFYSINSYSVYNNNIFYSQNNNFPLSEQNTYLNILNNNDEINTTFNNLNYSPINFYAINKYNYLGNENNLKIFLINKNFNLIYSNIILNLIDKTNVIFFSALNNTDLFTKITTTKNLPLEINYNEYKLYYYKNSIFNLTTIYDNLNIAQNITSINYNDRYSKQIILYIFENLKGFFAIENYNYFYTLYYFNYLTESTINESVFVYEKLLNDDLIDIDEFDMLVNDTNLVNKLDIYTMYTNYISKLISNSLFYEQTINRIIYILSTSYLIDNSIDQISMKKLIYSKTLYDIVKLYINNNEPIVNSNNKVYLNNTSIYSNQSIFQIYNFENMYNNLSFTQNYWINNIISEINLGVNEPNSYYNLFLKFNEYIQFFELDLLNFKLDNGIYVLEYFKNINNYDEFLNLIFNYICLNEAYSPNLIFINIVDLLKSDDISSKLIIDTNHIIKKITIFLFFTWIILNSTTKLLIDNFEINEDIVIEYNLEPNVIYDVKLKNVLSYKQNMKIINWAIYQIYNMEPTIENKNLIISDFPDFLQNKNDIIYFISKTKILCTPVVNFNLLSNLYIKNYYNCIGNVNMYTDSLLINSPFKPSLTNLISNINIIFNIDTEKNYLDKYTLTFNSLQILKIRFGSMIYDLNNSSANKLFLTSDFTFEAKKNYNKTVVNDFNLLYNLSCLLLKNYSISYNNLYNDFNATLNYLRNGSNNINELFEVFKGYISNYCLSLDLTSLKGINKMYFFITRIFNISKLNKVTSKFNNLSIITPNDYDNIPITINYNYSYPKYYNKYYSYNYNYNNFVNNSTTIYKNLFTYYSNIVSNTNAIKNIKKFNMNLYVWLFVDLINSFISSVYYTNNSKKTISYYDVINQIIKIYFLYNYSFRLNNNLSSVKNLFIQKIYSNVPTFSNYLEINNYLLSYYYYQLFSNDILENDSSKFTQDVILFFNTFLAESNVNFMYIRNFLNLLLKFEIIIRFVYYKISSIYGIQINNTLLNNKIIESIQKIKNYIIDINNIYNYFNSQYFNKLNSLYILSYYEQLFTVVNNLLYKNIFFEKFTYSLSELIYWINEDSYDINVINTWIKYFANVEFEYFEFINDQYAIKKFTFDIFSFYYMIYTYIYFILLKDNDYMDELQKNYIDIYRILFNTSDLFINPDIINEIILMKYDSDYFLNNNKPNLYINKDNVDFNLKSSFCLNNIFNFILNNYWGIINYNIIDNIYNSNLRSYITFYNMYYSYLNYLITNNNNNNNEYNFAYNLNIFDELYILYILIINIYTIQFINIPSYYTLEEQYLIYSHQYLQYNIKINTLDLTKNFSVYMDNLNSNIIPDNNINNYYKIIQNNSIYDSTKYKINDFINNINSYSEYTIQIYNGQVVKLNLNDEFLLGSNTFYNIIINTFNNLTSNVNIYLGNINTIINDIYYTIVNNIQTQFSIINFNFGIYLNDSISINSSNTKKIFNQNNYKNEKSQITILSLLNNQIIVKNIINNIPILLFYYSCYITWTTVALSINYDTDSISDIFYSLANIINTEIISFLNNPTSISANAFFDNLNILLFNNYNNYEFTIATSNFFNQLINIRYGELPSYIINNVNKSEIIINNIDIVLPKLSNNKIINNKYLLGLLHNFNNSKFIYYIKSIDNVFNDVKIQQKLVDYIIKLNYGIINEYGIIQLINRIELLFDDEIISQYFNYNYKVFIDNFQNINKQGLLNQMLNLRSVDSENYIVSGLKPYLKMAYKKNFIVPVKFFFENYFNSIPLIACMNTNIIIKVYLNSTNIYKNSYYINFLTPISLINKLNSDFILIEREERIRLSTKKIDYLIEINNYYELVKNITNFLNESKNVINIDFEFELDNLVKQIIWSFQIKIDNYEINILKNIDVKLNLLNIFQNITLDVLSNSNYDFIINTKFYFDGLLRDGILFLDSNNSPNYNAITTTLNPYKYNTKVNLNKNYNTYSFALEPTDFQPTGAINMSNYKTFKIQIQLDRKKFLNYLNSINTLFNISDVNFKISITTYEYNLVRYQSSLAGLLFVS